MSTVEERLASLEARMDATLDLRNLILEFRGEMNRRFDQVDRRFEAVERRFDAVDRRFDSVDRRFEGGDRTSEGLDQKIDRHFMWLVGTQIAMLVAALGWLVRNWSR